MNDIFEPLGKISFNDWIHYNKTIIFNAHKISFNKIFSKKSCFIGLLAFSLTLIIYYMLPYNEHMIDIDFQGFMLATAISWGSLSIAYLFVFICESSIAPIKEHKLIKQSSDYKSIIYKLTEFLRNYDENNFIDWKDEVESYISVNLSRDYADDFICLREHSIIDTTFYTYKLHEPTRMQGLDALKDPSNFSIFNSKPDSYKHVIALQYIIDQFKPYTIHGYNNDHS